MSGPVRVRGSVHISTFYENQGRVEVDGGAVGALRTRIVPGNVAQGEGAVSESLSTWSHVQPLPVQRSPNLRPPTRTCLSAHLSSPGS